jgi:phosphatidylinositol alpha-mannosyltransferase
MRICQVSDTYLPTPGGIPEHIYHLSKELRRRGHYVRVLTANFRGPTSITMHSDSDDEQFIHRVGRGVIIPSNRSYARLTVDWHLGHKVKKFFLEEKFDVVHIHGSLSPGLPLSAIKESRGTTIATFHSEHQSSWGYRMFREFLNGYFRRIHGIIAVSESARDSMAKYFPGDYRLIPNGVDTDFFTPDAPPLPAFNNNRPKILFMGRFEPRKGLTYLLKALPIIKQAVPDVQCIVVGAGPFGYAYYSKFLDKSVVDDVHFPGLVPGPERPRYYATCDVFCAPSTGNESFGIVLLEAMATGKPVVASDINGYRNVLADGIEGLLSTPCDEQGIADRIIPILKDRERARKMGEAGRAKALTYSWPRVTDRIEAFYQEVIDRRRNRPPAR